MLLYSHYVMDLQALGMAAETGSKDSKNGSKTASSAFLLSFLPHFKRCYLGNTPYTPCKFWKFVVL